MNNAEMIAALRWCPSHGCEGCNALDAIGRCTAYGVVGLMHSAADALEAQQKRIVELNTKCADLQSQINSMENEIEELSPKEGEWIENDNGTYSCNRCGSWIPNEQHFYARYCLYCGARMKGEQE